MVGDRRPRIVAEHPAAARIGVGEAHSPEIENVAITAPSSFDAGPDEVKAAQAIILGTTENFGKDIGRLIRDWNTP